MKVDKYDMPDDLLYQKNHCWARKEGDLIVVGFDDFGQQLAGTVKRIQTLEEEDEVSQDKPFGTLSTGKWTGKLYAPVTGEITEVNEELEDEPSLINTDPYGEGWIIKIEPSDADELDNLIKGGDQAFADWMKQEIGAHEQ
jgi:glycine cleavage system H protein